MNLVDFSGWMEYFPNGPQANFFKKPIEDVKSLNCPFHLYL